MKKEAEPGSLFVWGLSMSLCRRSRGVTGVSLGHSGLPCSADGPATEHMSPV